MKPDMIVLGAGIVGVSAALHLQARGRSVVLVDRKGPGEGTSYGNAGLIERASVVPYAFPRELTALLRYSLNRSSDVRYDPRFLLKIAPFLFSYFRHSSPKNLAIATKAMLPLIEASVTEHDGLIAAAGAQDLIREGGWSSAYKTPARFEAGVQEAADLSQYGLNYEVLDAAAFNRLEPSVRTGPGGVVGALRWRDPKTVTDPGGLTKRYAALFEQRGGRIVVGDAATLRERDAGWALETLEGPVEAAEAVVALGPQSGTLLHRLGYPVPLAIKRGYHRHYPLPDGVTLNHPFTDEESGYVLAPMRLGVRLTTGIEFAAADAPPNMIQITADEKHARKLLPLGAPLEQTPWLGLRPCLPDMRPVIGKAPRHRGLWFDFGHAHHGLTLGPASGRLLAELVTGETPFVDPTPYRYERFGR